MANKSVNKSIIRGGKSESVTERIFMEFYGINSFMEKSEIPSHYGFKSKKGTSSKGFPDFFRDDKEEDFVIIVEAKADDYAAACSEVEFYAKNNSIDKDIVAISISGQDTNSYKAGLFFLLKEENYKEIKTDGKLLKLKDISKLYRKEKFGDSITSDALKTTIKKLNKNFQEHNIKDTERSLFLQV